MTATADAPPTTPPTTGADLALFEEGFTGRGRTRVSAWNEAERTALLALVNFDPNKDNGWAHISAWVAASVEAGLNPFRRETHLIKRGQGDKAKYTMQTGIDGYRKMAASTGRLHRVKWRLWTGSDDDPDMWREVVDDGMVVVLRRWWEQWPAGRGNPSAAKVVVEYYDDHGVLTTTPAVGDWGMFAAYDDVWEDTPSGGRRKTGEKKLSDMWAKGGPHMLSKCVEALAYRMAFPARMAGFYTHEEMSSADAAERSRLAAERAEARRAAFRKAKGQDVKVERADAPPAPSEPEPSPEAPMEPPLDLRPDADGAYPAEVVEEPAAPGEPVPAAQAVAETVQDLRDRQQPADDNNPAPAEPAPEQAPAEPATAQVEPSEDEQRQHLLDEADVQASVLNVTMPRLFMRAVKARRRNHEDWTLDELRETVIGHRRLVLTALRAAGRHSDADAYERAGDRVLPVGLLLTTGA